MALNWSVKDVNDFQTVCYFDWKDEVGGKLEPVTNALIWKTLAIGLGRITEKNAAQFYARVALLEKLDGASLYVDGKPRPITVEDVQAHIGLTTNVTDETRTRWTRRTCEFVLDEAEREFKNAAQKAA